MASKLSARKQFPPARTPCAGCAVGALALLAACDSGSPIQKRVGSGQVVAMVGPGGRVLRGEGGTDLEGLLLDVPAGALDRLVKVKIETGPDIEVAGTRAASRALVIRLSPDPGPLRELARLTVRADLPEFRDAADLVVVNRASVPVPPGAGPLTRIGVASTHGTYERKVRRFSADLALLADVQVRLQGGQRQPEDAIRLVNLGYKALQRLTDASLAEADGLFAAAVEADPHSPSANFFRAVGRCLVIANDRRDDGPGLDSLGEALRRFGLDVQRGSLLRRLTSGDWPRTIQVPPNAPNSSELAEFFLTRVRPALQLALQDLAKVSLDTTLLFELPSGLGLPAGERELDLADLLFFRSLLAAAVLWIDLLADYDLDADPVVLGSRAGQRMSIERLLARFPAFGRIRRAPSPRTAQATAEALFSFARAFAALEAEDDPQGNDLIVFARSLDAARRDLWRANLRAASESLLQAGSRTVSLERGGTVQLDLLAPFSGGALDLRSLAPDLAGWIPLAGTLVDPELRGLVPGMTQARASDLIGFADRREPPRATIRADGDVGDWPAAARALVPVDPRADVSRAGLRGLDIVDAFLAWSGDDLAWRVSVADGPIAHRADQPTFYTLRLRVVGAHPGGRMLVVRVAVERTGAAVTVTRNGRRVAVRSAVGYRGGELEVLLNRFDLREPDEPVVARAVAFEARGLDLRRGREAHDRTRPVLIQF